MISQKEERGGEKGDGQGAEIALLSRQIPTTAFSFRFVLLFLVGTSLLLPLSAAFSWGRIDKHRGLGCNRPIGSAAIKLEPGVLSDFANFSLPLFSSFSRPPPFLFFLFSLVVYGKMYEHNQICVRSESIRDWIYQLLIFLI